MAAQLTATGVTFSDGTSLSSVFRFRSKYCKCIYQAAAPTGWTQVTAINYKALRLVNGTGGGFGFGNTTEVEVILWSTFPNNRWSGNCWFYGSCKEQSVVTL